MANLRGNIIANYMSQAYVAVIGIFFIPFYIDFLGAEAYGIIGFFAMLQAWFAILDMGLTPTIARETARYRAGAIAPHNFYSLFRFLRVLFYGIAVIGYVFLSMGTNWIAEHWLTQNSLSQEDLSFSLALMALLVPLRWVTGLYRGLVMGAEKLVWLGAFNALVATSKFAGVLLSMFLFGFTLKVFFIHQLIVSLVENATLMFKSNSILPKRLNLRRGVSWSIKPIKPLLRFSITIGFTSSVWVFVTQTDKLILSGILPLNEYGYFTLAVLLANGIIIVTNPISQAILPRLTKLFAEGNKESFIGLYRSSTQLVAIIGGAISITMAVSSYELILAWTGSEELANHASPILGLYAIGNLFLSIASFSYYLQYAKGVLKYHLIGSIAIVLILIPAIYIFTTKYGSVGAGVVWLTTNLAFLMLWVAFIHKKLEPNLHVKWVFNDVLRIIVPTLLLAFLVDYLLSFLFIDGRIFLMVKVFLMFSFVLFSSVALSSEFSLNFFLRRKRFVLNV
ncbi:oligosaccharide flippase family protein [Pseudoalteromonas sp. T1lg22]|uniref:oligosaccharide flippase family protein n=1 Tax=Pseudoalteromonas sp. T1lg22 TaxID=2077096 RepID=UPI000CF67CB4|nr:oligosaccharide flippase family protein [Pseudoalteromonas sp. T1lg22]